MNKRLDVAHRLEHLSNNVAALLRHCNSDVRKVAGAACVVGVLADRNGDPIYAGGGLLQCVRQVLDARRQ